MKTITGLAILFYLSGTQAQSKECDCYAARLACGALPGANQASCSSDYAACLGYVPTDSAGAFTVPSTCSTAPSTPSSTAPATTTTGNECQCYAARQECDGQPGANHAYCASQYAACLGYAPTNSEGAVTNPTTCSATPTPTGSKECQCYAARQECDSQPGANHAYCASQYGACLGYVPTNSEGAVTVPTTCGSATSSASPTPTGDVCACYAARMACGAKPGANQAECSSEYAACLGYVPTDSKGAFTVPSTCGTSYTPITYTPVTYTGSPTTTPVKYTGAANMIAGSPLLAAALAVMAL